MIIENIFQPSKNTRGTDQLRTYLKGTDIILKEQISLGTDQLIVIMGIYIPLNTLCL